MRLSTRFFVGTMAASSVIFTAAAIARAETCTLELKRFDQESTSNSNNIYRASYPQSFFAQIVKKSARVGDPQQAEAFKRIVKKEPKYESENPFRGVAKLGSQEFAFVLDAVPPAKEATADAEKAKDGEKAKKEDKKSKTDSATDKLAEKVAKATAETKAPSATPFNRLYFDLNHNGDLTDDKVIESDTPGIPRSAGSARQVNAAFNFPRIDLTLEDNGVKSDYSFFLQGRVYSSPDFSYTQVLLNAGAYREGDITIEGKKRHVALIDFNSNGRFGDEIKLQTVSVWRGGKTVSQSYPQQGDMLLIDPTPEQGSPYDVTSSDSRNYVSKMVSIDGKFYDVTISPSGDKLTLEPSSLSVGKVTNPSGPYRAVIYGDHGFLKIRGDKDTPAVVPEGEWRLLSYTIECREAEKPKEAEEKKADEKKAEEKKSEKKAEEKKSSSNDGLIKRLQEALAASSLGNRPSVVTAEVSGDYKAVKVIKGETVVLPFGPPYKPTVTADFFTDGNEHKVLSLGMSLIGAAGETCSNMTVNGSRPSKPEFTITDDKGKVVQEGSFEYG